MEISMLNQFKKQQNILDGNCLKQTSWFEYQDEADSERYFFIEDNGSQVAKIEACCSNDKAGMQILKMETKDMNLEKQKEALRELVNYIWDGVSMNHLVLAIHVLVDRSGIDYHILNCLGFIASETIQSYTILNPKYMELVEVFAKDQQAYNRLTEYYERYQEVKDKKLKELERKLQARVVDLDELDPNDQDYLNLQNNINYYKEIINSLGDEKRNQNDDKSSNVGSQKRKKK